MKIISNCPLCEEHSLHVIGEGKVQTQQCINCGYVTAEKLKLNGKLKKEHKEFKKLSKDMKRWVKVENDRIWLPTMMVLPFGMLYPINKDKKMKWAFSEMVDIPEKERKKYPKEDGNGFHNKRINTDNPKIYDLFLTCISELNKKIKNDALLANKSKVPTETKVKLPKLKKISKD